MKDFVQKYKTLIVGVLSALAAIGGTLGVTELEEGAGLAKECVETIVTTE